MRRRKALSVRVRNPSRGLVTLMPTDEADEFRPGDKNRVCIDAQNVRFEDGCISAAPGYKKVTLVSPLLEDLTSHWRMNELAGEVRVDSYGTNHLTDDLGAFQVEGKIGNAAAFHSDNGQSLSVASNAGLQLENPFTIAGWVKFSDSGTAAILWKGTDFSLTMGASAFHFNTTDDASIVHTLNSTEPVTNDVWYFVAVYYDGADLSIRVNETVDDVAYTTGIQASSDPLMFNNPANVSYNYAVDSFSIWNRVLTTQELDTLYSDGDGLDFPFIGPLTLIFQGNVISDDDPKPLTVASGGDIHEVERTYDNTDEEFIATLNQIYSGVLPSEEQFKWSAVDFFNKEVYAQHDNVPQYWIPGESSTWDVPGLPDDESEWDGVEAFFGHLLLWKGDKFKWSAINDFALWIPVGQTAATFVMTVDSPGFTQPSAGGSIAIPTDEDPSTEGVVVGQYIRIDDEQSGVPYTNFYQVTAITPGTPGVITATLLDLTGISPPASTIVTGSVISSVDANESGEARNVGSEINGPIYQILAQGDYAYIFKERSIQSIQYVGLASGVFFVHPEISNEGLLTRNSLIGLGDGRMVFVGHREIYAYAGGPTLTPILQQVSRQFYDELDRSRLEEILLFQKEFNNEIWIQYPVIGGNKVLVWNYKEDTATFDVYNSNLGGISAIAEVEWPVDPSWDSLSEAISWSNFDQSLSWSDMSADGADRFTLMATGDTQLQIHGIGFNRDGEAYPTLAETQDFDFDEPDVFKYTDVVVIGLQVKSPTTTIKRLYVQLGYRDWLDDDVKWTTAVAIQVQGNYSPPPVKFNPGGAGRFMRLKFYSTDADIDWRVTSYEIHTRQGNTY